MAAQWPLTFADPGRFEVYCHHSPPTEYPEESHDTLQICVPLEGALYRVVRSSDMGRTMVQNLEDCLDEIASQIRRFYDQLVAPKTA